MYSNHKIVLAINSAYADSPVDHINGDVLDNKFNNLRYVTNSLNRRNSAMGTRNRTGKVGVKFSQSKSSPRYVAYYHALAGTTWKGIIMNAKMLLNYLRELQGMGTDLANFNVGVLADTDGKDMTLLGVRRLSTNFFNTIIIDVGLQDGGEAAKSVKVDPLAPSTEQLLSGRTAPSGDSVEDAIRSTNKL